MTKNKTYTVVLSDTAEVVTLTVSAPNKAIARRDALRTVRNEMPYTFGWLFRVESCTEVR